MGGGRFNAIIEWVKVKQVKVTSIPARPRNSNSSSPTAGAAKFEEELVEVIFDEKLGHLRVIKRPVCEPQVCQDQRLTNEVAPGQYYA